MQHDAYKKGIVGTLYNPFPYLIENAPTSYYGPQSLYGTVYLPFIIDEYDGHVFPLPFTPPYTTAIALCAEKAPDRGIYASSEVVGIYENLETEQYELVPFASIIPLNEQSLHYNGPFNTLQHLNKRPEFWFFNPIESEFGVSVLEGIQKFSAFTHDFFDWNGYDKAGNICISSVVSRFLPTGFSIQKKIISFDIFNFLHPEVSRDIIGHEISHGILVEAIGPPSSGDDITDDPNIPNPMMHPEMDALIEGFCDIMGLSMDNWYAPGKFDHPNWIIAIHQGNHIGNTAIRPFNDPKQRKHPNTYLGQYYKHPQQAGYDPHSNAEVMNFWFYLLNAGKSGFVDDRPEPKNQYEVLPLIPGDKEETYKLALRVVFKTFTEKLTYQSTFDDVREATLGVIQELGHPIGSHAYIQMRNAWFAVGVGKKWDPGSKNPNCNNPSSGLSWYHGRVEFKTLKTTLEEDPGSPALFSLKNCMGTPTIQTQHFNFFTQTAELAIDADADQIFHPENNAEKSKSAVGIHWATEYTNNWFKDTFNHIGLAGDGSVPINTVLGDPTFPTASFDINDKTFHYPYAPEASDLDAVVQTYFQGVNHYIKSDENLTQDYVHPDWESIRTGIGQIFALNVKNQYLSGIPHNKPQIWTLGDKIPNNPDVVDVAQPEHTAQPKLYQGKNWDLAYPARNASLIAFWYYLLVHGTPQSEGYLNEKGNTYFVFPISNDLVLRVIWNAYQLVPLYGTMEEFRLATHQALHNLGFDQKSREYIALHDAWAAVLNMSEYAANLKTEPENGQSIYPWTAKLGVEVEYPLYESSRIFEVSESPKFDDETALVYRFLNFSTPDLTNGMSFGRLNLLPGKTYFWRSHQYESGSQGIGVSGNCDSSPDPIFCLSLKNKQKWTPTYTFNTAPIGAPDDLSPGAGSLAKAWETPFQWNGILGAEGYSLHIAEKMGRIPEQEIPLTKPFDEDEAIVYHQLALGKDKSYTWNIAAKAKTGSAEGIKKLEDPLSGLQHYVLLSEAEKAQFPDAFSDFSEPIEFNTDIPTITLGIPADGTHVPMLGTVRISAKSEEPRADRYLSRLFLNGDFKDPELRNIHAQPKNVSIDLHQDDYIEDGHVLGWTITPIKDPVPPFIPEMEEGASPAPFHLILDKSLIPKPNLVPLDCVMAGKEVVLKWEAVSGASVYQYQIKNLQNQQIIAAGETDQVQAPPISQASEAMSTYEWRVSAGIQDRNQQSVFGEASIGSYGVLLPKPINLNPSNTMQSLGANRSISFNWDAQPGVNDYRFSLYKKTGSDSFEPVIQNKIITGNALKVENLEHEKLYQWHVAGVGMDQECINPSKAEFNTHKSPAQYDLGFTLYVQDLVGPGKQSIPGSFIYSVEVIRPDGTLDFKHSASANNSLQIGFSAGNPAQVIGGFLNGQLMDQEGDYVIKLTIESVFSGLYEPAARPEIIFKAQEYMKESGRGWKLQEEIQPDPPSVFFPGRAPGTSVHLKFHYEKPN